MVEYVMDYVHQGFGHLMIAYLVCLVVAIFYMIPTLVAIYKKHERTPLIGTVNFFVGWTLIGWIACIMWALSED